LKDDWVLKDLVDPPGFAKQRAENVMTKRTDTSQGDPMQEMMQPCWVNVSLSMLSGMIADAITNAPTHVMMRNRGRDALTTRSKMFQSAQTAKETEIATTIPQRTYPNRFHFPR
jgi:hypothetical protein